MKQNLQKMKQYALVVLLVLMGNYGWGQTILYEHSFGTTTITGKPYNVSPVTFNSNLSNSSWTTSTSGFNSSSGSSGQALSLSNSSGTPTYTLTFNVATGFKLSITQFNFWRQRSSAGAPNWSLSINNINVGSGTTPTSGTAIGNTNVANSVSEITGTVTVVLTLSGASGTGTFRLDDFKLIGTVESLGSNTISTGTLTGAPFCVDGTNGAAGTIAYTSTGTYNGTFTAQLSDANGSFDSPVAIGTGTSPIAVNIPADTALGSGYRVRVVNDDPATVGTSSTAFSVINTPPTITTPTSTSITASSAVLGGNVTVVGCTSVTTRGIEYSTTSGFSNGSGTVVSESGTFSTGTFTVNVTGLTSGTTYYYKAFASSASGTSYTTEASFSTLAIAAPLALNATGVGATSFTANWDAVPGATSYEIDVYAIDAGTNATDLFISEYVEGSSNNKYIEIFNGTGADVDLSDYEVRVYNNGSSTFNSTFGVLVLSGILQNNQVIVFRNSGANISGTDSYATTSVAGFNGNDALALYKISTESNVDIFGRIGNDPGVAWTGAGGYSTLDKTLVRKSSILSGVSVNPTGTGSSAFTTLTTEWDLYDLDNVSNLGSHTFDGGSSISYILQNQNVGNVTSYQVTGLDQNTTYYYVVRAKDATSESVNSNEITTTTAIVSTTYTTSWSNSAPTASIDAIINGNLTTTTDLVCKDLTINSGKTLTIAAGTTLTVSNNLVNNGSIVFKSNNTSTGRFGPYNGSATLGSVTMERYIDGKRAFRFLAPGVTTSGTIADNWQEQVFITGSTTGANGFDTTVTGAPSMFTYENSGWAPISNTDVLTLNAQKGYRILIRGDRTPSILTSPSNGTMNNPVTLTATGTMITGDVPYNTLTNQDYTLVANPYISPINWATVTKNNISDTYYAWDPNLGTGNQRGRYVSCDVAGNTSIISGTGSPSTDVDQFIQPGQAVFIQKTTSGVNGSVTIKETDKAATFTDVFRTPNNSSNAINGKLGVNLYESLAYSLGEYPIDGAVVVSGTTFNTNSASDDTKKIMSHGEQVAFVRDNIQLGIEKISAPQENDELSIACINLVPNKNYVWSVVLQDGFSNEDAYLYDAFTQMYHPLTGNSVISFNTTDDVHSSLVNRFKIVFQNAVLSNATFQNTLAIYPNPAKAGASFYVEGISEATVTVSNLLGQTVPVQTKSQGTTLQVTPNTSLSQGVYLVNITTQGTTQQVKWIVE